MDYSRLIRFVDKNKKGDITPLLENKKAFKKAVKDLVKPFLKERIDKVAGIEARGFIFAGAVAYLLGAGFVMVRKGGKLPCKVLTSECVDYTGQKKLLEIPIDAVKKGERILVIDDWVETGAQTKASIAMIEELGGIVVGVAAVIDYTPNDVYDLLSKYHYHFLVTNNPDRGRKSR